MLVEPVGDARQITLPAADRDAYLRRVATLLHGQEIGDGTVSRAARQAQREFFKAPILHGTAGEPRHEQCLGQRQNGRANDHDTCEY